MLSDTSRTEKDKHCTVAPHGESKKNKADEEPKERNRLSDTENERRVAGRGGKADGRRSTGRQLQSAVSSTRNIVSDTVVTMYGTKWAPDSSGSPSQITETLTSALHT